MSALLTTPHGRSLRHHFELWARALHPQVEDRGRSVSEESYQATYRDLLDACMDCETAVDATDEEREMARRVEELALPWMNLEAVRSASPDILHSLWRAVDELRNARGSTVVAIGFPVLLFMACFCVIFLVIVGVNLDGWDTSGWTSRWEYLGTWIQESLVVNRSHISTGVIVTCAGLLSLIGAYLIMRSPRTY